MLKVAQVLRKSALHNSAVNAGGCYSQNPVRDRNDVKKSGWGLEIKIDTS